MQVATGKSILNGIAIGPLRIYHKAARQTVVSSSLTPAEEWERFDAARKKAQEQLGMLYEKALNEVGEDHAAIFEIHQMMLDDEDYLEAVKGIIETQLASAEHAVSTTGENFAAAFAIPMVCSSREPLTSKVPRLPSIVGRIPITGYSPISLLFAIILNTSHNKI